MEEMLIALRRWNAKDRLLLRVLTVPVVCDSSAIYAALLLYNPHYLSPRVSLPRSYSTDHPVRCSKTTSFLATAQREGHATSTKIHGRKRRLLWSVILPLSLPLAERS